MGNYSFLFATTNGTSKCTIDWKKCHLSPFPHGIYSHVDLAQSKIVTLEDLAHLLDGVKVIGYLNNSYIHDLKEICLHLVYQGEVCTPRLYFDFEGWYDLYYLEFHPGTEIVMLGVYPHHGKDLVDDDDGQRYQKVITDLHQKALNHVEGWKVSQLIEEQDKDPPGSALNAMCMIQGISIHDTQAVQKYLSSLDPSEAKKLITMRVSDLLA